MRVGAVYQQLGLRAQYVMLCPKIRDSKSASEDDESVTQGRLWDVTDQWDSSDKDKVRVADTKEGHPSAWAGGSAGSKIFDVFASYREVDASPSSCQENS